MNPMLIIGFSEVSKKKEPMPTSPIRWHLHLTVAVLTLSASVATQSRNASLASSEQLESVDEVVVRGKHSEIAELRRQIFQAESTFFERYNEVNTIRDFDVICRMHPPIGSNIKRRQCLAVYMIEARDGEFGAYMNGNSGWSSYTSTPTRSTGELIAERRPDFSKNLQAVTNKNPELRKLVREHKNLLKRYKKIKGKPLRFGLEDEPSNEETAPRASD
jgi:hypothetical protein